MRSFISRVFFGLSVVLPLVATRARAGTDDAGTGADPQAQIRELREQVDELRTQIRALRENRAAPAQTGGVLSSQAVTAPWASAHQPEFKAVLNDAEAHSRLLDATDMTAGWTAQQGFFLRSEDGNFLLNPFSLFQARAVMNYRSSVPSTGQSDTQTGFEIRRLQLGLDGYMATPDLTYRIFWQSSELTSGNLQLLMAWVQYRFHGTPWVIGGGQFKDPLDHEQLVSDAKQLAADRTYVDDILAGGEAFSRGVTLRYDDRHGPLRAEGALTSGFNVPNTNFQQFPTNPADYGVAARGEYKLLGNWLDYEQFTSEGNRDRGLLVIGAGADYTEAGPTAALRHVADVQFNSGPVALYAAYLGRYTRGNPAGRGGDTYDASARAQIAWLFAPHWETFARYDYLQFDGREFKAGTRSTVHEITIGGTYYFHGQRAKFTADLAYLPNGAPLADLGNDILASPGKAQLVGRAQFQLML